jgi:ribosomal protein S18 acetylase RimI-like enzyme
LTDVFKIEALSRSHDRAAFSSGVHELDRYLRELASQDIRRRISNCFVAVDPIGKIAGYYTFAATSVPLSGLPPDLASQLPRYPVLPACRIGRLAVDETFRGRGLGNALIVDAVARAIRADPAIFIVDAKNDTARTFYEHHGFRRFVSRPMTLYLPIAKAARRLAAGRC